MYCKACGKQIESDWSACAHCGRPIGTLSGGTGFWDIVSNDIRPSRDADAEQREMVKKGSNNAYVQRIERSEKADNSAQPQNPSARTTVNGIRNNSLLRDGSKVSGKKASIGMLSSRWKGKNRKLILLGLCAVLLLFVIAGVLLTLQFINPKRVAENYSDGDLNAVVDMEQLNESPLPEVQAIDLASNLEEEIEKEMEDLREKIEELEVENGALRERLETIEGRQYFMIEMFKYMHKITRHSWDETLKDLVVPEGLLDIPMPEATENPREGLASPSTTLSTPRPNQGAAE